MNDAQRALLAQVMNAWHNRPVYDGLLIGDTTEAELKAIRSMYDQLGDQ